MKTAWYLQETEYISSVLREYAPDAIDMVYASPALFDTAVETHETYADQDLSFTDAMTVVMIKHHDIDAVLSFDDDFDGVVDRLDPESVPDQT